MNDQVIDQDGNDLRIMTDHESPMFSQLIVDWFSGMPVEQQIDWLKLIGVPHDRREAYIQAIAGRPVAISTTTPAALTSSLPIITEVDITPTMAIEGAPGQDRPMPQVGSRQPKVVQSKRLS
jgi:hypothetical protein